MSRIGKLVINIPDGVDVKINGRKVEVSGPKGTLFLETNPAVELVLDKKELKVKIDNEENGNLHGLTRSLLFNMVKGVADGWNKILELSGTGFRATTNGSELQLALGFSHPVTVKAPAGITFEVKENKINVLGADKIMVGEIAAKIRGLKPADPYKAKGFKYENEVIIRKAGKAAKTTA